MMETDVEAPAPQLELRNITKVFPNVRALDDVSIEVRPGETLALMGENGAGKSTLLKVMTGAYQFESGEIRLMGVPVHVGSPIASRRLGIRVAYQEPDIVAGVTVAENLFLGELPRLSGRRVDWRRLNDDTEALLAPFRLGRSLAPSTLAERLSPAHRQMIEILRALRGDVKVLALDEPTSSLSDSDTEDLFALIAQIKARGVGLIYVSHRMQEILRLADRVSVLRDGALVGTRLASELDDATLVRMMVGRSLGEVIQRTRHATPTTVLKVSGLTSDKVSDIDITVCRGEVVGLAGLIGAGRTELGKTIFGAFRHDSGEIEVEGRRITVRRPRDAIDAGIAYTPEERKADALLPERSVSENATLAILRQLTRFRLVQRGREQAIAADYVRRLRVKTPSLAQPIGKLSGGNQQKVVLARWLATKPKVLILDEPTRGIDVGAKAEIYALIDMLAQQGMGILLISSELPEILRLSDRIVCMQAGTITGELSAAEASEERVLQLCMALDLASAKPTATHSGSVN
jgi:L-arabinose transport system ATP-binding protein